ncbi:MAG: thioredoxin family protein [Planctomycetota bacterium]
MEDKKTTQLSFFFWLKLVGFIILILVIMVIGAVIYWKNTYKLKQIAPITTELPITNKNTGNPLERALKSGIPVVADFGRGKCIPCKMMKPILEELMQTYKGKAEIFIFDIDEYSDLTTQYGIQMIPTQLFFDKSGKEVMRHEGFFPKEEIVAKLEELGAK